MCGETEMTDKEKTQAVLELYSLIQIQYAVIKANNIIPFREPDYLDQYIADGAIHSANSQRLLDAIYDNCVEVERNFRAQIERHKEAVEANRVA